MKKIEILALVIVSVAALSFAFAPASDAAGDARLEAESVTAPVGSSSAEVKIDMTSNPGIWGLGAEISYDSRMTLVGVESYGVMEVTPGPLGNPYRLYCENENLADTDATGVIIVLKFSFPSSTNGTMEVSISNVDAVNVDGEQVEFATVSGGVNIGVVTSVILNPSSMTMSVGESRTLDCIIRPSDAVNKKVTWSSSNESIATVSNGVVTAKSSGLAYIVVETEDGKHTDSCSVLVLTDSVPVTGVTINTGKVSLGIGDTYNLSATVEPSNATNKNVTWKSSDESVAMVTSSGKVTAVSDGGVVTAKAVGKAVITVTTEDGGKTDTCTVTVSDNTPAPSGGDNTLLYVGIAVAVLAVIIVAIFVMRSRSK